MSIQPATSFRTNSDQALLAAWRRFLDYDSASVIQKLNHNSTRRTIIILGFAASTLAVISTFVRNPVDPSIVTVANILRVVLILIPAIMAGLMTYAVTFSPSLSWLAYRIGAELVRRDIYMYRMQAGEYATLSPVDQQTTLLQHLQDADKRVHRIGVPDPYIQATIMDVPKIILGKTNDPNDDGFSSLSVDQYIAYRVYKQKDWYLVKSRDDYDKMRRWRIGVIVATGMSAVVAALGWEVWVAVTTAFSVALATYMDLKMFGRNYPIYHPIANLLEIELDAWSILPPEDQANPAKSSMFVKRVEDLFQSERDQWTEQAIQTQQAIEQSLSKSASISRDPSSQPSMTTTNLTVTQPDSSTTVVSLQAPTIPSKEGDSSSDSGQPTAPGMTLVYTSTAAQNDQPPSVVITGSTVPPSDSAPTPVIVSPNSPAGATAAASTNGNTDSVPAASVDVVPVVSTNGSPDSASDAVPQTEASTPAIDEGPAKG
ncbi:MAG: DUF4231 domain-containing protein [Chloroflexota bacterium]